MNQTLFRIWQVIKGKKLANSLRFGRFHSMFKGKGLDLEDIREFQEGDEIRDIDWNAFARFGHPYVKTFKEERQQPCMLAFDISSSMNFGKNISKREFLKQSALLLAEAAVANRDRIGLLLFSDRIESYLPPRIGRRHLQIIKERLDCKIAKGHGTSLSEALRFLSGVEKKRTLVFLFSDCFDLPSKKEVRTFQNRHELIVIRHLDPAEKNLVYGDFTAIEDLETKERIWAPVESLKDAFSSETTIDDEQKARFFPGLGCSFLNMKENIEPYKQLQVFLKNVSRT